MKTLPYLALIALIIPSIPVSAQDESTAAIQPVDISEWRCKFCEVEEGWSGELSLGIGQVSDDSFQFGEYNGLNESGSYFIADAELRYRNETAGYLNLSVSDLGLDSRSLKIEGGTQGSYTLFLTYDELPHFISDSASSPYQGINSDTLTLPAGWVRSSSTGGMTSLGANLQAVDIATRRKQLATGFSLNTDSPWSFTANVRRDEKDGNRRTAGTFLFSSSQLVAPVNYVTDEVNASVSYRQKKWQARLAYLASSFTNDNQSLTWENAFTPLAAGADIGELALAPDNQFHQLNLSAAYNFSDASRLSAEIAVGRMEQNEDLLAATQNGSLTAPALPTNSANAEVDTTNAKLKYVLQQTDRLRLNASYTYSDRENNTPQLFYGWVSTDTLLAPPRSNQPYGFTRGLLKLEADYKLESNSSFAAGFDQDVQQRSFQEVDETTDNRLWGALRVRNLENVDLQFKFGHSERSASSYETISATLPPQNQLMRKYNMADRDRNSIGLYANLLTEAEYSIGINLEFATEDYNHSELGLIDSEDVSFSGDIAAMLSEETSLNVFLGNQVIKSRLAGSQNFSTEDWSAKNRDSFKNYGIGVTHVVIENSLDIGADYTRSRSSGEVVLIASGSDPLFPVLRTDLDSVRIYANYHLDESMQLQLAYWYEEYDVSDWSIENVSADTVSNLLSLGESYPDYSNHVIKLSLRYRF